MLQHRLVQLSVRLRSNLTYSLIRAPPTNVGRALLFLACPSVCPSVSGHPNSLIFNKISSEFHIWIASINLSFKFEYEFCPTSVNQDGQQNGHHISISAVVVTLTVIFNQISSKFHIWIASINLLFKFE